MQRPVLWVASSQGTLLGLEARTARLGVRVHRLVTLRFEAKPASELREQVERWGPFDTLVVTSPRSVETFVRPVLSPKERHRPGLEVWAVGSATERALHRLGFRGIRRSDEEGAAPLLTALARPKPRSIVYPRSDRAGRGFAAACRTQRHRVLEVVAYRTVPLALSSRDRARLVRGSPTLLVTSPSALSALRSALPLEEFRGWRSRVRVIALGRRTERSARGHGFLHVDRVATASVEGIMALLAREARHAPA